MTLLKRRLFERHTANAPMKFSLNGGKDYYDAELCNSCTNGLAFDSIQRLSPETQIDITIPEDLPQVKNPCEHHFYHGKIRWCSEATDQQPNRFRAGAQLLTFSKTIQEMSLQPVACTCDYCETIVKWSAIVKTDHPLFLCPDCYNYLERMPDGLLKQSVERFLVGNVI